MLCKCSGKYIDIYFNLKITYSWVLLRYSWALWFVYSWALCPVFLGRLSGGEEHEVAGYDEGHVSTGYIFPFIL